MWPQGASSACSLSGWAAGAPPGISLSPSRLFLHALRETDTRLHSNSTICPNQALHSRRKHSGLCSVRSAELNLMRMALACASPLPWSRDLQAPQWGDTSHWCKRALCSGHKPWLLGFKARGSAGGLSIHCLVPALPGWKPREKNRQRARERGRASTGGAPHTHMGALWPIQPLREPSLLLEI